jgi:peptidoglycan/xylan/chitin deacetylase (PgdA/CDA1 family)
VRVQAGAARAPELRWVLDWLLRQRLGLDYELSTHEDADVVLHAPGGRVRWADTFLRGADSRWLEPATLPGLPLPRWHLPDGDLARAIGETSLPLLFGDGRFEPGPGEIRLPCDISGSAFFMLSRYEEAVRGAARDRHGRFPGRGSIAGREAIADRPVVDEWVEVLAWALQRLVPGWQRPRRPGSVWVSCDVDAPYSPGFKSMHRGLRHAASLWVNERQFGRGLHAAWLTAAARAGIAVRDPVDTFDWMLDVNERAGRRMTFFFIARRAPAPVDGWAEIDDTRVHALLRRIVGRGHEVGLHGSYGSVDEPQRIGVELDALSQAVRRCGGTQGVPIGTRQHYLRWHVAGAVPTARALAQAGLAWDSTLGYADLPGFRCGTGHAFPVFDLEARAPLPLVERPLVLMEVTLLSRVYGAMPAGGEALAVATALRRRCERLGGEFALLWHNNLLLDPAARAMYEALVAPAAP